MDFMLMLVGAAFIFVVSLSGAVIVLANMRDSRYIFQNLSSISSRLAEKGLQIEQVACPVDEKYFETEFRICDNLQPPTIDITRGPWATRRLINKILTDELTPSELVNLTEPRIE
jgi:hypothetical protein